jgi:hypothetical protein
MNLVVGDTIRALSSHHGLLLIQKPTGTIDRGGKTHMIIEEILQVSASQYVGKDMSQARQ